MSPVISFLPLALTPCLYAGLVKLAALLYRRTRLKWSHALIYGVLTLIAGALGMVVHRVIGSGLSLPFVMVGGLALQLLLGGWYFRSRATTAEGAAVQFRGGVLLSLVAYLLVFVLGVVAAVVVPVLQRGGQA